MQGHLGDVYSLVFTPDGRNVVSGSFDRTVRIWSVARRDCVVLRVS